MRAEIALLTEHYRATQSHQVEALAGHHGTGPCLRQADSLLRAGGLLDDTSLSRLTQDAEHDAAGRREQDERREVYLEWREHAARQLPRRAGPLGRLTHRPDEFYPQLDQAEHALQIFRRHHADQRSRERAHDFAIEYVADAHPPLDAAHDQHRPGAGTAVARADRPSAGAAEHDCAVRDGVQRQRAPEAVGARRRSPDVPIFDVLALAASVPAIPVG